MSKLNEKRLVDKLLEAYLGWREACLQVSDAYGSWAAERGNGARVAFASYLAALDREESAAAAYAGAARRAGAGSRPRSAASR